MAMYHANHDKVLFEKARDPADTEQAVSNVLWALAVLDELDPGFAEQVCIRPILQHMQNIVKSTSSLNMHKSSPHSPHPQAYATLYLHRYG